MAVIPPKYCWIKRLRVGDVVEAPSGRLRVVRYVSHRGENLSRTHLVFVIAHPSWTGRGYTCLNGNDLKNAGYRPTMARYPLDTDFDRLLAEDIASRKACSADLNFSARDVAGIP